MAAVACGRGESHSSPPAVNGRKICSPRAIKKTARPVFYRVTGKQPQSRLGRQMVVRALTAPYSRGCSTAGKESRLPRRDDCQSISSLDDATLLAKAKAGDPAAFAWLYERHVADALRYARSCHIGESAARDLVTESFMRVLGALRRGCGPMTVLWPYLAATMRSVAYERSHEATPSARGIFCGGENFDRAEAPECDLIRRAFASLPSRWQYLLWRVDVEGEPVAAVGGHLVGECPAARVSRGRMDRQAAAMAAWPPAPVVRLPCVAGPSARARQEAVRAVRLGPSAGAALAVQIRAASRTAMMPVMKTPSKVPAPPIDTTGAPSRCTFGRLAKSAPASVPRVPP